MLWKIIPKFRGTDQKSMITLKKNFNLDLGVTNKLLVDDRKFLDGV